MGIRKLRVMEFEFSSGYTSSVKDEGPADLQALPNVDSAKDTMDMAMACGQGGLLKVSWLGEMVRGCGCPRELGSPKKSGQKVPEEWSSYLILLLQRIGHNGSTEHTHTHHCDTLLPKMLRVP